MTADMGYGGGQGFTGGNDYGNTGGDAGNGAPTGGVNPAWNEVLSHVPQDKHSAVTPLLQSWDQNFQKVQSSIAPYKEFIEGGVPAENIRIALGLVRALDEQPESVYQALHQEFGQQMQNGNGNGQQGQLPPGAGEFGEDQGETGDGQFAGLPPEFMQQYQGLQSQVETMREILLGQKQERDAAAEDQEVEKLYKHMAETNPMFAALNEKGLAEPYMNSMFIAGYDEKQALEQFSNFVDAVASYHNRPRPPQIMGAGGFMPEQSVKPRQLDDKQAKDVMVQMLRQAHGQG